MKAKPNRKIELPSGDELLCQAMSSDNDCETSVFASRLREENERLKAAWDAIADEFPGPHEGWITDDPASLMLKAVRGLKAAKEAALRDEPKESTPDVKPDEWPWADRVKP